MSIDIDMYVTAETGVAKVKALKLEPLLPPHWDPAVFKTCVELATKAGEHKWLLATFIRKQWYKNKKFALKRCRPVAPVVLSRVALENDGIYLDDETKRRTLKFLENEGVIRVERGPGRSPKAWMVENRKFCRNPLFHEE